MSCNFLWSISINIKYTRAPNTSSPGLTQTKKQPSHTFRFARKPPPSTWSLPVDCYRNKTALGGQGPERVQSLNRSHNAQQVQDAVVVGFNLNNLNTSKGTNRPSRLEMSLIDTPQAGGWTLRGCRKSLYAQPQKGLNSGYACGRYVEPRPALGFSNKGITGFHGCKHTKYLYHFVSCVSKRTQDLD